MLLARLLRDYSHDEKAHSRARDPQIVAAPEGAAMYETNSVRNFSQECLRRRDAARPTRASPTKATDPGSGTFTGGSLKTREVVIVKFDPVVCRSAKKKSKL